jgi:hypothetical protein
MGALAGFIVGYIAGVNSGPQGLEEMRKAWQVVSASEEFQGLLAAATGFVQNLIAQGGSSMAEQIQTLTSGNSELLKMMDGGADGGIRSALGKISETPEYQAIFASGAALLGKMLSRASTLSERVTPGH